MSKSSPTTPMANTAEIRQDEASRDITVEENAEAKQGEKQQNLADLVSAELAARGITEPRPADIARAKLTVRGITEEDVARAVKWARSFGDDE